MATRRWIAFVVLLALVVVPVLGMAGDDSSASMRGHHRDSSLRHPPARPWRTVPAAVEPPMTLPPLVSLDILLVSRSEHAVPLLVRTRFIPPRPALLSV